MARHCHRLLHRIHHPAVPAGGHGQIGRLFASEDAIHIARRAPELVEEIDSITNQAAGGAVELEFSERTGLSPTFPAISVVSA
jgi:hypothetical protein